jgi:hypothetical protein
MPARTFEDSAGVIWEVFEVHRSSQKSGAVSAGLERGWLAFVSGDSKRRLAPFPSEWVTADAKELERLCGLARLARATGLTRRTKSGDGKLSVAARSPIPRIRPSHHEHSPLPDNEITVGASVSGANAPERTVREFAQEARARGLPAIGAMIQLKALLARLYPGSDSPARDVRAVRRWFVESYYFDRGGEASDGDLQSR